MWGSRTKIGLAVPGMSWFAAKTTPIAPTGLWTKDYVRYVNKAFKQRTTKMYRRGHRRLVDSVSLGEWYACLPVVVPHISTAAPMSGSRLSASRTRPVSEREEEWLGAVCGNRERRGRLLQKTTNSKALKMCALHKGSLNVMYLVFEIRCKGRGILLRSCEGFMKKV